MKIQISHGADPDDWFVVSPLPGATGRSVTGTVITSEMAVDSLRQAGRSVYELDVKPWQGHESGREARAAM